MMGKRVCLLMMAVLMMPLALVAQVSGSIDWLDVPVAWSRTIQGATLLVVPDDLPRGASLRLVVAPLTASDESLRQAYDRTCRQIGQWSPIGDPVDQQTNTTWLFRQGVGNVVSGQQSSIGLVAVAQKDGRMARFWALADSAVTYNRYKQALANAIASVQDADIATLAPSTPGPGAGVASAQIIRPVDPAFGQGLSGAYLGLERGLSASASASTPQLMLDLSSGFLGIGTSSSPQTQLSITDYPEIDVLFPDGSFRRRLPARGLASDLAWDREHFPTLWGTWRGESDGVVATYGRSTKRVYRVAADRLIDERQRPWRRLPVHTAAQPDGVYARADYRDPGAPRLVLRADGSYQDVGGFLRMVGSANNLVVPDGAAMIARWSDAEIGRALAPSSGTFTLEAFTLSLFASDGRVWQINAYVPPTEAPPQAKHLVVNTYALIRD